LNSSAGSEISQEEGNYPLIPSSTMLQMLVWLKLYGCRHQAVPGDINAQHTVGCGCFEVVVDVEGSSTTTSWMFLAAAYCL